MKNKLSTEPYKGVRDFYPEDMFVEKYIYNTLSKTAESFGYSEYGASVLEPIELYEAKTSEEIVNEQTYLFEDRGGRKVALRPEMTPTIARMVAARKRELPMPIRWYTSANVFRYEKPQRGRLREHIQFNVDTFGAKGPNVDFEIISLLYSMFKDFGAEDSSFSIALNDRNVIAALYDAFKIKDSDRNTLNRILDRKNKISANIFEDAINEILKDDTAEFIKCIEIPRKLLEKIGEENEAVSYLISVVEHLDRAGIRNVVFTPTLVRGFDYYTGIIFEVFDTDENNKRSLAGGGRYDNILDAFEVERVPAIGFGIGDVTLRDFLETHGLMPEFESSAHAYMCVLGDEVREKAKAVADTLRSEGVNLEIDLSNKKIGDQIKLASKKKIPFVIIVGESEVKENIYMVKNLKEEKERGLKIEDISSYILGVV